MTVTVRVRGRRFEGHASAPHPSGGPLKVARRAGFATFEEAETWARRREAEMLGGGAGGAGEAPDNWADLVRWGWDQHYCRSKSAASVRSILDQSVEVMGGTLRLLAVNRGTLSAFVTALRDRGDSEGSVKRKLGVVRKLIGLAVDEGWISAVPKAPPVQAPRRGRLRWLTDAELDRVVEILKRERQSTSKLDEWLPDCADLFVWLADTGLRLGEALALRWSDVQASALLVHGSKTDRNRRVPLTTRASHILEQRRDGRTLGPWSSLPLHHIHRAWNIARHEMGFDDDEEFVPHALRHTFASRLVQAGASIQLVQQLLGHQQIEMTMIYAHLTPGNLESAVALLDARTKVRPPDHPTL